MASVNPSGVASLCYYDGGHKGQAPGLWDPRGVADFEVPDDFPE